MSERIQGRKQMWKSNRRNKVEGEKTTELAAEVKKLDSSKLARRPQGRKEANVE